MTMRRVIGVQLVIAILVLLLGMPTQPAPPAHINPGVIYASFPLIQFLQSYYDNQAPRIPDPSTVHPEQVCIFPHPANLQDPGVKGFLYEFKDSNAPLDKPTVPYEWAPVIPGTSIPGRPTVSEPLFVVSGVLEKVYNPWDDPTLHDLMFSHAFGKDFSMDIDLVPESLAKLNLNGQPLLALHAEIELGLFPYLGLGFKPAAGDWVALKGDWIVDCGHTGEKGERGKPGYIPPHVSASPQEEGYGTEIHPPTFLAFARRSGNGTDSIAVVNPFRATQLYNGANPDLANDFQNYRRFTDSATGNFAQSLSGELHDWTANIGIHQLYESTNFENVGWRVCAPRPSPPDSKFYFSYKFTARTGIGIEVIPEPTTGCLQVLAVQGPAYTPAPQVRQNLKWTWQDINSEVLEQTGDRYDVQQAIFAKISQGCAGVSIFVSVLTGLLIPCGCIQCEKVNNSPFIDKYDNLSTRSDSWRPVQNNERVITEGADDQPFPFYGKIRVWWALPPVEKYTPGSLPRESAPRLLVKADPSPLQFTPSSGGPLVLTINNLSTIQIRLGTPVVKGADAADFVIDNGCSHASLAPGQTCMIRVTFRAQGIGPRTARLVVPFSNNTSAAEVDMTGPGLIQ